LLLTGPSGIGKRESAWWLSQVLLCDMSGFGGETSRAHGEPAEEALNLGFGFEPAPAPQAESHQREPLSVSELPCGTCPACHKAISGNWIDFTEIAPQGDDEHSGSLKIEQFRKLKATQGFGAYNGNYRITLIRDADRLTPQAANSLLKILEEPPAGWIFLLTASDPSLLLPTLVSRCQKLRLSPLSRPALVQLLHDSRTPSDRLETCADLAQGSYRKALQMAENDAWDKRAVLFRFLEDPAAELTALTDWASSEDRNFRLLMDQFEQLLLDLVSFEGDPEKFIWKNKDGSRTLSRHARTMLTTTGSPDIARAFWLERSERLFRMRQESLAPLNRKILAQDFLSGWVAPPAQERPRA
jgi:DNA polymerase-3 subunit delta'